VGGLNFQIEHHLFSTIYHFHYPEISEIVKNTAEEFGIPYLENKTL
jgi:linoleoyl-CoA desaturase